MSKTPKYVGDPVTLEARGYPHHPDNSTAPIGQLLAEREVEYGPAWLLTGEIVDYLRENAGLDQLIKSSFFYAWISILCKLIRIVRTPNHLDSWRDIIGYATLVVDQIELEKDIK